MHDEAEQMPSDGLHHRESTETGPTVPKAAQLTGAAYSGNLTK